MKLEDINKCIKCESENFFITANGPHQGIWCYNCGTFYKFGSKKLLRLLKAKGQIINK